MVHIPKDARWYLADVVLEYVIEGDPRNLVHINVHLIEADSPERAYEKAQAIGRDSEHVFTNTDAREVRVTFRGLRDLNVIHDALEDGAELAYEQSIGVREEQLTAWLRAKKQLSVFGDDEATDDVPNYMLESIMQSLENEGIGRDEIGNNGSSTD